MRSARYGKGKKAKSPRIHRIPINLTEEEMVLLRKRADVVDLQLATFIRTTLMRAVAKRT